MALEIQELLNRSRLELLDLSTRNRLLSIPVNSKSARVIQIFDELSEQVMRLLVAEKKSCSFLPGKKKESDAKNSDEKISSDVDLDEAEIGLPQPDEEIDEATGLAKRHVDSKLQTSLTSEGLQQRLLALYRDAQMLLEEQGVNILYLALGHLKWFEADQSDVPRFAPLVLLPVELIRKSASDRFHLRWREEEIQENLSLGAKLKTEFGITLPELSSSEDFDLKSYFDAVSKAVSGMGKWEVLPNAMTLGFFSFAKFLLYRDLDPAHWPEKDLLLKNPLITGLLQDGFDENEPLLSEDAYFDDIVSAEKLDHVVDADSSQSLAIEMVRRGRNLVIQGPPGTGKSQSIANIISTAVLDGKKVLFVAEKLAALEVVKRRLEREELGDFCLELHSNKTNKRTVIEEIGRTWKLGRPKDANLDAVVPKLSKLRDQLNTHATALHDRHMPSALTFFDVISRLVALGDCGREASDMTLPDAVAWNRDDITERRNLLNEIVNRVKEMGSPSEHIWRGVCRETVLKIDLDLIETQIRKVVTQLSEVCQIKKSLAEALKLSIPTDFTATDGLIRIGQHIASAPQLDKQAICNSVWNAGLSGLRTLLEDGLKFSALMTNLSTKVIASAVEKDFSSVRTQLAAKGESLFRIFNKDYRLAMTELKGVLNAPLPKSFTERVNLVDQLVAGHKLLRSLHEADAIGQSAFGTLWKKEKTDWVQAQMILDWIEAQPGGEANSNFRSTFAATEDQNLIGTIASELGTKLESARSDLVTLLTDELKMDFAKAFGVSEINKISFEVFLDRASAWLSNLEKIYVWNNYFIRVCRATEFGLQEFVSRLESKQINLDALLDCFDRVYFSQMLRELSRLKPELARFDGMLHDQLVTEFKATDIQRLTLGKLRTLLKHHSQMPMLNSNLGATGIVRSEMERKRGHRTVRRLLKDAGSVVQAIKPVFMMSPLSVAQFIEPGAVEFDLLVIDEASQVQPVDSLGAIARCKQIVVVGDSRQLPPSKFFSKLTSDSNESEDAAPEGQAAEASEIESILGLCCARGLPQTMLRWHYRSRHQSLIAVSNHEFYENRLFIVPSPHSAAAAFGLKFKHVPEGVFDSGNTGTNCVEAKAICRAVIEHARKTPQLSLGVVAFSVRQKQAIQDELEFLRRENPDLESFFASHSSEPFFVKNLENVQGDERDVIFISVGYGRDVHGYMAMRFGPLSNEGGERRLNVLISRAKKRCEVFSSITAEDIDLERARGRGVHAFKTFLNFAQTGKLAVAEKSGREADSYFEESVRKAIEAQGYEVHAQVGIAGFFIDLAILDTDNKGRYLLGIECDGASYHSSRSARDRDRLRQAVLEDHGWIIHRIWSTDWFQRPNEQLRKVIASIERAKVILAEEKHEQHSASIEVIAESEDGVEREVILSLNTQKVATLATPYSEANFEVPKSVEMHNLSAKEIGAILLRIVQHEGPIHEDELTVRLRNLWGLQRAGNRIQDAVARGVRSLLVTKQCVREDNSLFLPNSKIPVRNRETVASQNLRKPEMLPTVEIRAGILHLIDSHHGISKEEISTAVAHLFGFKTTSRQLSEGISAQVDKLVKLGSLKEVGGMLRREEMNKVSV